MAITADREEFSQLLCVVTCVDFVDLGATSNLIKFQISDVGWNFKSGQLKIISATSLQTSSLSKYMFSHRLLVVPESPLEEGRTHGEEMVAGSM